MQIMPSAPDSPHVQTAHLHIRHGGNLSIETLAKLNFHKARAELRRKRRICGGQAAKYLNPAFNTHYGHPAIVNANKNIRIIL